MTEQEKLLNSLQRVVFAARYAVKRYNNGTSLEPAINQLLSCLPEAEKLLNDFLVKEESK